MNLEESKLGAENTDFLHKEIYFHSESFNAAILEKRERFVRRESD